MKKLTILLSIALALTCIMLNCAFAARDGTCAIGTQAIIGILNPVHPAVADNPAITISPHQGNFVGTIIAITTKITTTDLPAMAAADRGVNHPRVWPIFASSLDHFIGNAPGTLITEAQSTASMVNTQDATGADAYMRGSIA